MCFTRWIYNSEQKNLFTFVFAAYISDVSRNYAFVDDSTVVVVVQKAPAGIALGRMVARIAVVETVEQMVERIVVVVEAQQIAVEHWQIGRVDMGGSPCESSSPVRGPQLAAQKLMDCLSVGV